MFNKITLIGRLCKDGEFKAFNSGAEIYENTLALNKKQKNGTDKTIFVKIKVFGNAVNIMRSYTQKGDKIGIIGELDYNSWQGQDGKKHYEHSIVVESIELLGSSSKQDNTKSAPQQKSAPKQMGNDSRGAYGANSTANEHFADDEIPF